MTSFSCYCNKHLTHILSSKYCSIQPYLLPRLCLYGGHFFFQNHTKNPILRCLKVYSYFHVRLPHLLIDFALADFRTFKKLSPSVCIFNLTSTSGKISVIICLQVNNFFPFLGNLNYYNLPGKYIFHFRGVCFHSWEISIVTFYQAFYHFPLPGKSQLLPSTR